MPFPERIRRHEVHKATTCGICHDALPREAYVEAHSFTSLHLVRKGDGRDNKYMVTDPPLDQDHLRGMYVNGDDYGLDGSQETDAVCLCPECHNEIHRIALAEARLDASFKGINPPPELLSEVTRFFMDRGSRMTYENVNRDAIFEESPHSAMWGHPSVGWTSLVDGFEF